MTRSIAAHYSAWALLVGAVTGAGALGATPANAQETIAANGDEIVVTARRREEGLEDVPAAVSVIGQAQRDMLVIEETEDVLRQIPGAMLVTSGPEYLNDISIRGQGGGRLGFSETATGLFRDGIYDAGGGFGGRSMSRMDFFDIERIEVMRGPQGALYGRNSVGGAINVITQRPEHEFAASAMARTDNYERHQGQVLLNGGIGDHLAVRGGAFFQDQHDGYIVNLDDGDILDEQDNWGARLSAAIHPTDTASFNALWEYSESGGASFTSLGQRPTLANGQVLDPSPYERALLNHEGENEITEQMAQLAGTIDFGETDLVLQVAHKVRDGSRFEEDGDHFDGATGIDLQPGAGVTTPDYYGGQTEAFQSTVMQTYLRGQGGAISWVLGAEALLANSDIESGITPCPTYTGALQAPTAGCIVGARGAGAFLPSDAANGGFAASAAGALQITRLAQTARLSLQRDSFSEELNSYSLFGALDVELTSRLSLGAELRVQRDEKDFSFQRYSRDPLVYFGAGAAPAGLLPVIQVDPDGAGGPAGQSPVQFCAPEISGTALCAVGRETAVLVTTRDWTNWTPTVTLHYDLNENQDLYFRFATGYRPGGFNINVPQAATRGELEYFALYDPEYAYSYEAGFKGGLFDNFVQVEAALFYTWTNETQVPTIPTASSRGFMLVNAGDAKVYGAELSIERRQDVGPGELMLSIGYATQSGEFDDGASAPFANQDLATATITPTITVDLSGREVPRLRDYQVTLNAIYTFPLRESVRGFIGASGQWASGGTQGAIAGNEYAPYSLYDMRIGLGGENWRFSVFGKNLTDERYELNSIGSIAYYSEPRSYGAQLSVNY